MLLALGSDKCLLEAIGVGCVKSIRGRGIRDMSLRGGSMLSLGRCSISELWSVNREEGLSGRGEVWRLGSRACVLQIRECGSVSSKWGCPVLES